MSKIGTGEGAQAYGHGLYFAENPGVAKQYRDQLSQSVGNQQTAAGAADRFVSLYGDGAAEAIKREIATMQTQAQKLRELGKGVPQVFLDRIKNEYEPALEMVAKGYKPGGRMYEVNINAAPEQFLDWDRPVPMEHPVRGVAAEALPKNRLFTAEPERTLRSVAARDVAENPELQGRELYSALSRRLHGKGGYKSDTASEILREAGIPGIKYLDQGSRGAGSGTNNYVLFRDDIIEILKKYGIAGLAALPALQNAPQLEQAQ
jgi:hypothetical protein